MSPPSHPLPPTLGPPQVERAARRAGDPQGRVGGAPAGEHRGAVRLAPHLGPKGGGPCRAAGPLAGRPPAALRCLPSGPLPHANASAPLAPRLPSPPLLCRPSSMPWTAAAASWRLWRGTCGRIPRRAAPPSPAACSERGYEWLGRQPARSVEQLTARLHWLHPLGCITAMCRAVSLKCDNGAKMLALSDGEAQAATAARWRHSAAARGQGTQ